MKSKKILRCILLLVYTIVISCVHNNNTNILIDESINIQKNQTFTYKVNKILANKNIYFYDFGYEEIKISIFNLLIFQMSDFLIIQDDEYGNRDTNFYTVSYNPIENKAYIITQDRRLFDVIFDKNKNQIIVRYNTDKLLISYKEVFNKKEYIETHNKLMFYSPSKKYKYYLLNRYVVHSPATRTCYSNAFIIIQDHDERIIFKNYLNSDKTGAGPLYWLITENIIYGLSYWSESKYVIFDFCNNKKQEYEGELIGVSQGGSNYIIYDHKMGYVRVIDALSNTVVHSLKCDESNNAFIIDNLLIIFWEYVPGYFYSGPFIIYDTMKKEILLKDDDYEGFGFIHFMGLY